MTLVSVPCTTPGCTNVRRVHPRGAPWVKRCKKCRYRLNTRNTFIKKFRRVIQEIQTMKSQGYDDRDIAEALLKTIAFVRKCAGIKLPEETVYKVLSADYWVEGIYIEKEKLMSFLNDACFDPAAVLERNGRRYRVIRRGLRQELRMI